MVLVQRVPLQALLPAFQCEMFSVFAANVTELSVENTRFLLSLVKELFVLLLPSERVLHLGLHQTRSRGVRHCFRLLTFGQRMLYLLVKLRCHACAVLAPKT